MGSPVVSSIKDTSEIKTGDTITLAAKPAQVMLPGYKEVRPMVFCGLYPIESSDYEKLKAALGRLRLNDSAFVYSQESSVALGFGFRCGFLGLLHMEIIQERIRREHDVEIISTYPSVIYKVVKHGGETIEVDNPVNLPDAGVIEQIMEPTLKASIHIPNDSMGDMLALVMEKRGVVEHTHTLDSTRVMMSCILPLNEILVDFNDRLKGVTHGYGSMDYEAGRLPRGRPGQDGDPRQRRRRRRLCKHCPQGQGGDPRPGPLQEAFGDHPPTDVPNRAAGRDRWQDHRSGKRARNAQGRDRQMLRRRHFRKLKFCSIAEGGNRR